MKRFEGIFEGAAKDLAPGLSDRSRIIKERIIYPATRPRSGQETEEPLSGDEQKFELSLEDSGKKADPGFSVGDVGDIEAIGKSLSFDVGEAENFERAR